MSDTPAVPEKPDGKPIEPARVFVTHHRWQRDGVDLAYRCIAGETYLHDIEGRPEASQFSFSYLADGAAPEQRPVIFAFNGGPGSASLWLHMGALGPKRVVVPSEAVPAARPLRLADNEASLLDIADLVFIDPIGTGYSRALGTTEAKAFWGLESDAALVARFIQRWLTEHKRWSSPRFLLGESYGTTRAVTVAGKLAGQYAGLRFDGIALVSLVLDFHTVNFQPGNPVADVCYLPSYAAAALFHGRVQAPEGRDAFIDAARAFAAGPYLSALFQGSRLSEADRDAVVAQLARFTGLSPDWLRRTRLRIASDRFRRELLRDRGQTIGRLDSRYVGRDYDAAGELPEGDPGISAIDNAYVAAANDHFTRALGVEWDRAYVAFENAALDQWDWKQDKPNQRGWPSYPNVAPTLGRLLREDPHLRVLVANGLYDFATPFHAAESTLAGNGVDFDRIDMRYYDAGHMMYTHEPSLHRLNDDIRALVRGGA